MISSTNTLMANGFEHNFVFYILTFGNCTNGWKQRRIGKCTKFQKRITTNETGAAIECG